MLKTIFAILLLFTFPICGFSQSQFDKVKSKLEGNWREQDLTKKQHSLNKIFFNSDTTGLWTVEGIICDCEFFKIYLENDKVYLKRLIILDGWSDPIEVVFVDNKRLKLKLLDDEIHVYRRKRNRKSME